MMMLTARLIEKELVRLWGEEVNPQVDGQISVKLIASIGSSAIGFIDIELTDADLALSLDDLSSRVLQPAVEVLKAKHG